MWCTQVSVSLNSISDQHRWRSADQSSIRAQGEQSESVRRFFSPRFLFHSPVTRFLTFVLRTSGIEASLRVLTAGLDLSVPRVLVVNTSSAPRLWPSDVVPPLAEVLAKPPLDLSLSELVSNEGYRRHDSATMKWSHRFKASGGLSSLTTYRHLLCSHRLVRHSVVTT